MKKIEVFLLIAVIIIGAIVYYVTYEEASGPGEEVINHELFPVFLANFDHEVLTGISADFDDDGRMDLLVVFKYSNDKNKMVVILNKESKPHITEILPAPIENIEIELKDIDKLPPVEFIISGSKNNNFGYGIYRIADDEIFDIFGADMRDCC